MEFLLKFLKNLLTDFPICPIIMVYNGDKVEDKICQFLLVFSCIP